MLANNSRFCLIQQNATLKNLGTMVLKQLRVEGAKRWKSKYGQDLVLIETFVQPSRTDEYNGQKARNGAIYLADNWKEIGQTSGNSIKKCPLLLWQKETGVRGELSRKDPQAAMEKYGNYDGNKFIVSKSPVKIMFVKTLVFNWKDKLIK